MFILFTEDIRKELNLRAAEGVAVMDIIGSGSGEKAGIKVGAVITEINKVPVRNLDDLGRLLPEALEKGEEARWARGSLRIPRIRGRAVR